MNLDTEKSLSRNDEILHLLRAELSKLLELDSAELDDHAPFLEMGADSLFLVEALRLIETNFGLKIAIRQIFEELQNLQELARYIDQNMPSDWPQVHLAGPSRKEVVELPEISRSPSGAHRYKSEPAAELSQAVSGVEQSIPTQQQIAEVAASVPSSQQQSSRLEVIIEQQLQIMAQELEVLKASYAVSPNQHPITSTPPPAQCVGQATCNVSASASAQRTEKPYTVELTAVQKEHLQEFVDGYTKKTKKSKVFTQTYRSTLADNRASAGFRLSTKETLYPIVGKRAQGAKIWDIDDNQYVDITMGFGVHLFGHNPDFIKDAIRSQLNDGAPLGLQAQHAGEVSRLICKLTGMERVAFCNTGTEAVMTALRLARTATNRRKVAMFAGSYHGHFDGTLAMNSMRDGQYVSEPIAPGVTPGMISDVLVLDYADDKALEIIQAHRDELAAVLVEPVQSRKPDLQPKTFLKKLRQITQDANIALVFDEMITGFRIDQGGAQAWFEVEADIATYGKIIGGGMPIGVVAGKSSYLNGIDGGLWDYGDSSYPEAETTFFAGTFCKHPLTMAAAHAVLLHLIEQGPQLQQDLNRRTSYLAETLNDFFRRQGVGIQLAHCGSLFRFVFAGNMDMLFKHLLAKGIYVWEGRSCFLSTAHTDEDIEFIIQCVKETVFELRAGGFITGKNKTPQQIASVQPNKTVQAPTERQTAGGFWERRKIKPSLTRKQSSLDALRNAKTGNSKIDFSLYYFGDYQAAFRQDKYDLLFEGAKFADQHDFAAIWVPERHFHSFGGFSPNPSVICAALARETSRLQLRAGSVVAPLHHPIRVAEEWSVVDNLSQGRVGISFASGWHPNDFVFSPESYGNHRELMFERIEQIQQLWRGASLPARTGAGKILDTKLFPMPMQDELPIWITIVNNADTYRRAGAIGAGVLTNLMGQTIEDLTANISVYRQSLAEHGYDAAAGHVTVLVHTFVGAELEFSREKARQPFYGYITSTMGLFQNMVKAQGMDLDLERLGEDDRDYILSKAYQSYTNTSALIGTPDSSVPVVDSLIGAGVNEIACFVDFGVDTASTVQGFEYLNQLRQRYKIPSKQSDAVVFNKRPQSQPVPEPADRVNVHTPVKPPIRRYKLTAAQEHLWVMDSLGGDATLTYNMCVSLKLKGKLNKGALEKALHEIVRRHESLRTTFDRNGKFQQVSTIEKVLISHSDLSAIPAEQRDQKVADWFAKEGRIAFDLNRGPLYRFCLVKLEEELNILVLSVHHIIIDGWSVGVIARELHNLYLGYCQSRPCHLGKPAQFHEYVKWQDSQDMKEEQAEHERYWLQRLSGALPALNLPTDRPRPPVITFRGARQTAWIEEELLKDLKNLARKNQCTTYMLLLSVFAALLHRLSSQNDVVVSVPLADRSFDGSEGLVGYCANQLPIRSQIEGDPTFVEFLAQTRQLLLEAYEHQDYQYAKLLNRLMTKRNSNVLSPLHAAIFNFNPPVAVQKMGDLEVEWFSEHINWVADEIAVHLTEMHDRVMIDWDYNTTLFDAGTVQRMLGSFKCLLRAVVKAPETPVTGLPLLTDEDKETLLIDWNNTQVAISDEDLLHLQFERQVRQTPDAAAVVLPLVDGAGQRQLTYNELNRRVNQLAAELVRHGVGAEKLVGVYADRSLALLIGLLAVLKAGGAYVPLDPAYPQKRLNYILEDADITVLLVQKELIDQLQEYHALIVPVDSEAPLTSADSLNEAFETNIVAKQLAYTIYTSGSTGKPKGVEITHGSLANFLNSMVKTPGLSQRDILLSVTSPSFDIAALELFLPLIVGAKLVICPRAITQDGVRLRDLIADSAATLMQATPSTWKLLLDAGWEPSSRMSILCGGEPMSRELAKRLLQNGATVYNLYGPTETTIWSTLQLLQNSDVLAEEDRPVPIGRPIANTQLYLLDAKLQPVPVGVPGELYIGGAGLARGYRNQPELTQKQFIPHPFSRDPSERIYKTGDLVRYLPNGNVEFLGRTDYQVKIRGFRVELGEIEAVLSSHPDIKESLVVAAGDHSDTTRLVAYIIAPGQMPTLDGMRRWLRDKLPDYMVPSAFVPMESFPLTPNGKIDRNALPVPTSSVRDTAGIVAPRDDLEKELQELWEEVLEVHPVGVTDDFFELGGHSFLAVRLAAAIQQRFQKRLPLTTLLGEASIERVADYLRESDAGKTYSPLVVLQPNGDQLPFFCVHPIGGHVICYITLARHLGPQQPFYAFQSAGIDGEGTPLSTIEDMAASYLQALQETQPEGPYHLGGWSIGGVIAYEMAQQLLQKGQEVASLTLIDSVNPIELDLPEIDEIELMGFLAKDLGGFVTDDLVLPGEGFLELDLDQQLDQLLVIAKTLNLLPPDARKEELLKILNVFRANLSAANRYRPLPYPGEITFFSAGEQVVHLHDGKTGALDRSNTLLERILRATKEARQGWEALALGGMEVTEIAADHYSLLQEPFVKTLAQHLGERLQAQTAKDCSQLSQFAGSGGH